MSDNFPADAVEVARILGAWGIKGWIKIQPYAEDPQALFSSKRWHLQPSERPGGPPGQRVGGTAMPGLLKVIQAKEHGDGVVACVQDISTREAAETLKGARIFVARGSFPTAGSNEFYWVDLIGLDVFNRQGEDLGQVVGLLETGTHCVLRVAPRKPGTSAVPARQPAERLIPFVDAYVGQVDLAARRIEVDWLPDWDLPD